jgi:hypothetical protein
MAGASESLSGVNAGVSITMPFDFVQIKSPAAQTVQFIVTSGRVEYDFQPMQTVQASNVGGAFVPFYCLGGVLKFNLTYSGYFNASGTSDPVIYFERQIPSLILLQAHFSPTGANTDTPFQVQTYEVYDEPGVGTFNYRALIGFGGSYAVSYQATELLR